MAYQKQWRVRMQLAILKIISPSGFHRWWVKTLTLSGHIMCMMERLIPTSHAPSSSDYCAGKTDQWSTHPTEPPRPRPLRHQPLALLSCSSWLQSSDNKERKSFNSAMKKAKVTGLEPFLIYPAWMKLQYKGEKKTFDSPQAAEDFINSPPRRFASTAVQRDVELLQQPQTQTQRRTTVIVHTPGKAT